MSVSFFVEGVAFVGNGLNRYSDISTSRRTPHCVQNIMIQTELMLMDSEHLSKAFHNPILKPSIYPNSDPI
ncbi:hypothetical protein AYI69_g1451 [Smittium culicis]|uniref:Uncharacterized protein n=1 Tax=Smittium culicis TaxID=133412 RepID=A0A1R1YQ90_9FUNG|nr:hypothetical protein AYI69_g1451 [Smittium culicis]